MSICICYHEVEYVRLSDTLFSFLRSPLGVLLAPLTLALELAQATVQLQALDERDTQRLQNLKILTNLATGGFGGGGAGGGEEGGGGGGGEARRGFANVVELAQGAAGRQRALARIGVRFGGSLAAVQAQHLRERISPQHHQSAPVSPFAARLAVAGADGLEGLSRTIFSFDSQLTSRAILPVLPSEVKNGGKLREPRTRHSRRRGEERGEG